MYHLWVRVGSSQSVSSIVALVGAVTLFPAMEAESFSDTSCSFRRGQFEEGDSIDVHGVRVVSGSGGVYSGELSAFQSENSHFLGVKYLGLFMPFCNGGGDRRHREYHCSKLLVKSKGKLVDESDVVGDACLRGKVLEVSDILLESIVHNSIRAFEQFLSELGELEVSSCFSVIGEKCRLKVGCKFVEGLFRIGDRDIHHLVIPHF